MDKDKEQEQQDNCVWMAASSFTIFTMTAGFGLLESGRVAAKDEVNVMVKNVVDVIFGGLAYWMFGFGFTFGVPSTPLIGLSDYFFDPERNNGNDYLLIDHGIVLTCFLQIFGYNYKGQSYAHFIFQLSFATTTSTIVSAGMAERIHLQSHCFISFVITIVHSITGHWIWAQDGWFRELGVVDSAGCSAVHLVGGIAGLVATVYLKPRQNRFTGKKERHMSDPTKAILGFLMIWWGWLAFNTSSNYSVSKYQWTEGTRSSVGTILASVGGGMVTISISRLWTKKIEIDMLIDGLLASLVSSTAGCLFYSPWQATLVGAIGSIFALLVYPVLEWAEIDDPVGVIPVHVAGSIWGMLAPALLINIDFGYEGHNVTNTQKLNGIFYGGSTALLHLQLIAILVIGSFSACTVFTTLFLLQHSPVGLRLSKYDEEIGADLREHGLAGLNITSYTIEKKLSAQKLASLMVVILRWRVKARVGAVRRKAAAANGTVPEMQLRQRTNVTNRTQSQPAVTVTVA